MIGCLRTRVRKQPIIALYFESENELKFYILEARARGYKLFSCSIQLSMKFQLLIKGKTVKNKEIVIALKLSAAVLILLTFQ